VTVRDCLVWCFLMRSADDVRGRKKAGIARVSITDRREVAFDAEAMTVVIKHSQRMARAIGLPNGNPTDIRFDPQRSEAVVSYGNGDAPSAVHVARLSALLISYCLRAGIKVPRNLGRSMRVDQDGVVLLFGTTYPIRPVTLAPEQGNAANVPRTALDWGKD
jgi:hypothetical protein